jgi:phage recombination protein Bet
MSTNGSTALARVEDNGNRIVKRDEAGFTESEIDLIKTQIAPGVSDGELKLFMHVCKSRHLDPFAKQIYAITREQWNNDTRQREKKMTIMASIDGMRLTAKRGGIEAIDEPEFEYDARLKGDDNPLGIVKASVRVWRKGCDRPTVGVAYWDEYKQTKRDGGLMGLWPKMPRTMIAKCAEAQALRKAAPEELSGIYAAEEMDQASNPPRDHVTVSDVRPVTEAVPPTTLGEPEFAFILNAIETCEADADLRKLGAQIANTAMGDEQRKALRGAYGKRRSKLQKMAREAQAAATSAEADAPPDNDAAEIDGEVHHAQFDE